MSMSSIPSSSQSGKLYGWVERIGNKVPILFALYLFDNRTHGDDGNFVSLWRQCEKPDRWYAGGGEKPAQCGRITLVLPNVIKNFSGFAPLGAILALV